jgi:hypothetical protein
MKPKLKAPGIKRLKLKHDNLLLSFAFSFNLRGYSTVHAALVEMLQAMLIGERGGARGKGLGVRGSATHELLVSSVLGRRATQKPKP